MLVNSEINLKLNLKVIEFINKISNNEKIDEAEMKKLSVLKDELKGYMQNRDVRIINQVKEILISLKKLRGLDNKISKSTLL